MAPSNDLLGTIQAEIDARLTALRPALAEYEQLLAAMQALDAGGASQAQGAAQASRASRSKRPPAKRGTAVGVIRRAASEPLRSRALARASERTARKPRAVRGVAREAILAALEHGSHTVGELVTVTAMSAPNVNGNVRKLLAEGRVSKTDRDGKAAYVLAGGQSA